MSTINTDSMELNVAEYEDVAQYFEPEIFEDFLNIPEDELNEMCTMAFGKAK